MTGTDIPFRNGSKIAWIDEWNSWRRNCRQRSSLEYLRSAGKSQLDVVDLY